MKPSQRWTFPRGNVSSNFGKSYILVIDSKSRKSFTMVDAVCESQKFI